MTNNLEKLEKKIGLKFKNKKLLIQSLTHKSSDNEFNNEKLEFLGDRVIGLILSKKLFDLYPHVNEGILDKKFAKMVNRKTCCSISWNIGLQHYIRVAIDNSKITKKDEKILSDSCEALIGFIYIDQGYEKTKDIVLKLWKNTFIFFPLASLGSGWERHRQKTITGPFSLAHLFRCQFVFFWRRAMKLAMMQKKSVSCIIGRPAFSGLHFR